MRFEVLQRFGGGVIVIGRGRRGVRNEPHGGAVGFWEKAKTL